MRGKVQNVDGPKRLVFFALLMLSLSFLAMATVGAQAPDLPLAVPPTAPSAQAPDVPADVSPSGGVSLGAIVITVGAIAGLGLAVAGGARFVTSENILDNEIRRRIFEHVRASRGEATLRKMSAAIGVTRTNLLWHLRKLEKARLVSAHDVDGVPVYYAVEGGVESRRAAIASRVLSNENALHVLAILAVNERASQREIGRALHVHPGTVRWHLRKLAAAELVALDARSQSARITPYGRATIELRLGHPTRATPAEQENAEEPQPAVA